LKSIIKEIKCQFSSCKNTLQLESEVFNYTLFDNYVEIYFYCGKNIEFKELRFEIEFNESPIAWRNHDYAWVDLKQKRISNELSPKILKFQAENYLMSNRYLGVWEMNPNNQGLLTWHIHHSELSPFFYFEENGKRNWLDTPITLDKPLVLKLYFGKTEPIEISRSKIPFSPVIIFTDHCDFDSDILLEKQREFFKTNQIKITKGFFLHHFSKKGDWNSSFERNEAEFYKWKNDGHELCYHALSQSTIWDEQKRINQFEHFESPKELNVTTWIDHGYQLYNLSKIEVFEKRNQTLAHLNSKGINLVWNYNDAGEVISNLNQNNYESFNFTSIWTSKLSFKDKVRLTLFYCGPESILLDYRYLSGKIKEAKGILSKINIYTATIILLLRCILSLKLNSKISTQILFPTQFRNITGFQTVVVKDWVRSFGEPLDLLVHEKGISIIHSYFAFLGKHHVNPLFTNADGSISSQVNDAFRKLGSLIEKEEIWNPTLSEFHSFNKSLNKSEIFLENGNYKISDFSNPIRMIQ
jgi:hypothetical protein